MSRLPSQQSTQLRVKLEICYTHHSICEQGRKGTPKASSGPRGVPLPPPPGLLQEKRGISGPCPPEQAWVSGLERALLAWCRLRVFNSFWHISCTRWKTVSRDPGATEGRARGGSGSDKICLACIPQAESPLESVPVHLEGHTRSFTGESGGQVSTIVSRTQLHWGMQGLNTY